MLEGKGYHISAVKNSWIDEFNPYNGINTNIVSKGNYEFEVQFHTPESLRAREKMHVIYNEYRVLDRDSEKAISFRNQMMEIANTVVIPEGIDEI